MKQRGSAQGCDATALFPLRGEEPCAVRPIPVRSKKTATFSHRFPSSARQLKTIPECFVGTRYKRRSARETSEREGERERCRKIKLKEVEQEGFFFSCCFIQTVYGPLKTNKGGKKIPLCPTDARSNKRQADIISL